jgi:eukaryotic-like serine/threonine-protein kinase
MALQPGSRLGPYQVLSLIGAGGMGEVYQARDTRLDRKVAVKVLAPELATDTEFRARFEREAKAISSLNHPHICGLYDIGREHDTEYLVLELLEGETLAARIERGPLPLAQVLRFGIEIADALEAAHRHGIVHRDLKPGNIMLTAAGTKLLDFGLAKHTVGSAGQALSMLATAPGTGTAQGTIIGTLQYMAPEQVQGVPADARTDIFALGTVLYEMATGRRAFEATTHASLIAKILETDVPAVSTLVPVAPPVFDHMVQGCLAKEPSDRWQTAHDVKMQLQWIQQQGLPSDLNRGTAAGPGRPAWVVWALTAAAFAALAATTLLWLRPRPFATRALPTRFDLILPPQVQLDTVYGSDRGAISPDGRHFVFTATLDGRTQLVMRDLASSALVTLPGTDSAFNPFWSPDSGSVGFFTLNSGQLKTIRVPGGTARVLAGGVTYPCDGTWSRGVILFGPRDDRIYRVSDAGGTATPLDTLPWQRGQKSFVSPAFLADTPHFTVQIAGDPAVYIASVDVHGLRRILDDASSVAYAAGHLFYTRGAGLFARPFDPKRLDFSGLEVQVTARSAGFSVSQSGTIVYRQEGVPRTKLTWFDRGGRRLGTVGEPGLYEQLVLSPRGGRVMVVRHDATSADIWNVDLASGIFSRVTADPEYDSDPSWSPDERGMAFTSYRTGRGTVFVKDFVSGKEEPLVRSDTNAWVDQWTPDGKFVIFRTIDKQIYAVPRSGDHTPRMLVNMPSQTDQIHVSPDGRWVAFDADESGSWEVYVAAFPTFTSKTQVSSRGGVQPQWRGDGRELFYLGADGQMMSVSVDTMRTKLVASPPARLFATSIDRSPEVPRYGVTADGQRFLALEPAEGDKGDTSFRFLLNWFDANSPPAQIE